MQVPSEQDYRTIAAMEKFGGGFVKSLAALCRRADKDNFKRIKKAFPEYFAEYQAMSLNVRHEPEV